MITDKSSTKSIILYLLQWLNSNSDVFKLNVTGSENGPLPKTLVANTETEISWIDEHGEDIANLWQYLPLWVSYEFIAVETVDKSQMLPEVRSEKITVYEVGEPSMLPDIAIVCYKIKKGILLLQLL